MRTRGFELTKDAPNGAILPLSATRSSVGYDFYCTEDIDILPQRKVSFSTGVKAYLGAEEGLFLFPRSSTGIKHDLMLANTVGIGESDFYDNVDNEGNYIICLRNLRPEIELDGFIDIPVNLMDIAKVPVVKDVREANTVHLKKGDRVVQGIFLPVLKADNCNTDNERTGGVGSTGK